MELIGRDGKNVWERERDNERERGERAITKERGAREGESERERGRESDRGRERERESVCAVGLCCFEGSTLTAANYCCSMLPRGHCLPFCAIKRETSTHK